MPINSYEKTQGRKEEAAKEVSMLFFSDPFFV